MAFRIPFNEFVTIEADTAADVRALISEFGVDLTMRLLPPAATRTGSSPADETAVDEPPARQPAAEKKLRGGRTDGRTEQGARQARRRADPTSRRGP